MSNPTEIKAQAIALHAMGHSCRDIEKRLRAMFPSADIPRYCTISRWVRSRPTNRIALMHWWEARSRAAEIVQDRINELATMPFMQMIKAWSRIEDITLTALEMYRER